MTILFIVAVGGFLTITVCIGDVTVPQELVVVRLMLYVPEVTKLKEGLADVAEPEE